MQKYRVLTANIAGNMSTAVRKRVFRAIAICAHTAGKYAKMTASRVASSKPLGRTFFPRITTAPENAQPMEGSRPRCGLEEKIFCTGCRRIKSLSFSGAFPCRARCIYAVLGVMVAQIRYRVYTCPRAPAIPHAQRVSRSSTAASNANEFRKFIQKTMGFVAQSTNM